MAKKKKSKKGKKKKPPLFMLLPFKPMMIKKLKKAGIKFTSKKDKKLRNVVELFHTHIIKKKNLEENFDYAEEYILDDIVKIIAEVFSFVKGIFGKKKKGEAISPDLADVADDIKRVSDTLDKNKINPADIADETGKLDDGTGRVLKDDGKGGISVKKGTDIMGLPMPLVLGGAGLVAYFLIRKK